jgi:Secretion system C-terminal sorting domain
MLMKLILAVLMVLLPVVLIGQVTINDGFINSGETKTLTANNTYLLDGLVYVEDGAVLNIEAGTVIKGKEVPTTGDNTSALIIARGGKINAVGTASQPIIFTAESDDVNNPADLTYNDRNLWGGVILLGYAEINTTTGVGQIEGIVSTEPRGAYGGGHTSPNDDDNSGIMRYVSIRHGGSEIGAGNEINGLTFGAVGRGTTIDHIEVLANYDDGYEWFGGTVNCKYLISAFCADDGFDYDEGFRGKGQFWFNIQDASVGGGRCAEQDGGTVPEDGMPYAIPTLSNVTYIGAGVSNFPQGDGSELMIFRDNAGGKYYSSIFTDYNGANGGKGITIEDLASGEDSRARLEAGDLLLRNNIWWQFANGNTWADIAPDSWTADSLIANNNQIIDPQIMSVSRTNSGSLDPRPNAAGPAASGATVPSDPFFTQVSYYGAFDPNAFPWIWGWTGLDVEYITSIRDARISEGASVPEDFALKQNYPNPFNPTTTIEYDVATNGHVVLAVFNSLGQKVATLVDREKVAGQYRLTWDASDLPTGIYFYQLRAGSTVISKKMMLIK